MIFFVYSLVNSAIHFARRQRLLSVLTAFFASPDAASNVLVCRRISSPPKSPFATGNLSSATLSRYCSEPSLACTGDSVLFRTEDFEVVCTSAASSASEWTGRCMRLMSTSFKDPRVDFVAVISRERLPGPSTLVQNESDDDDAQSSSRIVADPLYLCSSCERIAACPSRPWEQLFSADVVSFCDVVLAWSRDALFDKAGPDACQVSAIYTVCLPKAESASARTLSTLSLCSPHRARPLLEQLFLGDDLLSSLPLSLTLDSRYSSESTLWEPARLSLLSRAPAVIPYFRKPRSRTLPRSVAAARKSPPIPEGKLAKIEVARSVASSSNDHSPVKNSKGNCAVNSIPPAVRASSSTVSDVANTFSPSITIDDFEEHSLAELRIEEELAGDSSSSSLSFIDRTPSEEDQVKVKKRPSQNRPEKVLNGVMDAMRRALSKDDKSLPSTADPNANGHLESPMSSSRRSRCERGESPMVEMFRRKMSATLEYGDIKVVDPKLQRLTAIELLQRRRHSSMAPVQRIQSIEAHENAAARGSLFGSVIGSEAFRSQTGTPTRRLHLSKDRKSNSKPMQKPPAVVVYTGGDSSLFERIRDSVHAVLPRDEYTVTELSPKALRTSPWNEPSTACILIADTKSLDDAAWARLHNYFSHSGKIMFLCQNNLLASLTSADSSKKQADLMKMAFGGDRTNSSLGKDFETFLKKAVKALAKSKEVNEVFHSKDLVGGFKYSVVLSKKPETPLLLYMENSAHQAAAVFSDATSEQLLGEGSALVRDSLARVGLRVKEKKDEAPPLSQGYLVADHDDLIRNMVSIRYGEEVGLSPKLFLRRHERVADQPLPAPSINLLPVEVRKKEDGLPDFDERAYFRMLKTHHLGRVLLYVPVATTTMDVCRSMSDAIPGYDGIVVVARQQTKGRGRGGNEFVSPVGAAMFTFTCLLPASSALAKAPSWLQHVFAVSVVDACVSLAGVDDFAMRIKWPNDFYWNRQYKLGGLLATARMRDDCMEVILGAGVNVRNGKPTVCLNDMLPESSDYEFSVEEVIAATLNKFEYYTQLYERKGREEFLKKYYEYWLHSREEVMLEEEGERVTIRGLDHNGYLEVRSRKSPNKIFSLMDDGNTFDMMKGLIRPKFK